MRKRALFAAVVFAFSSSGASAAVEQSRSSDRDFKETARDPSSWQDSFLRNVRAIQRKEMLRDLEEQNAGPRSAPQKSQQTVSSEQFALAETSSAPDGTLIYQWFSQNQAASPIGLVTSYPEDASLSDQGFTYDQALSGILMLEQGDSAGAGRIFDFYNSQWDGSGFWTVYNVQSAGGAKIEYDRVMGPNAWIGLFSLRYYKKTNDARALDLATKIGLWIRSLPHKDGGVAMGAAGTFWGSIYSVENNLDYYALARGLSALAKTKQDRQKFSNEITGLNSWFKNKAYDPSAGLFKRSPTDTTPTAALDSNSWAILVFGASGLKKKFGIDVDALVARAEAAFGVQDDGSFGGSVTTAKGFDFSDSANASHIGRTGMKWVEGTNQMISVYGALKTYYSTPGTSNAAKAALYQSRVDYFSGRNSENLISSASDASYVYTDQPGTQIWWDNPYWKASSGPAVGSSAWVYYSSLKINPFAL